MPLPHSLLKVCDLKVSLIQQWLHSQCPTLNRIYALNHPSNQSKQIKLRVEKWEEMKEEKKNQKKQCPYSCGKAWKSICSDSVRAHLIGKGRTKCPNFPSDGKTLLKEFYTKEKRSSFAHLIS